MLSLLLCVACAQPAKQQTDTAIPKGQQEEVKIPSQKAQQVAPLSADELQKAKQHYLVPSPGEILSSLDKLDRVAWNQLASYNTKADYDDKYARALNLGVRAADAFMAVNSQDAPRFGEMSTIVFDLAREIGLGDVLEGKRSDLDNLAAEGKWEELKAALDNVQNDVQNEVEAMGEDELVVLASAGGWMEGIRAVSAHLKDNYSDEHAELMRQGRLIRYYLGKFEEMPADVLSHPLLSSTQETLAQIAPLLETESGITQQDIAQVHALTSALVDQFERGE